MQRMTKDFPAVGLPIPEAVPPRPDFYQGRMNTVRQNNQTTIALARSQFETALRPGYGGVNYSSASLFTPSYTFAVLRQGDRKLPEGR